MSVYVKIALRVVVLTALIAGIVTAIKPVSANAFSCISQCFQDYQACRAQCNNLPGNELCFSDCFDSEQFCIACCNDPSSC